MLPIACEGPLSESGVRRLVFAVDRVDYHTLKSLAPASRKVHSAVQQLLKIKLDALLRQHSS